MRRYPSDLRDREWAHLEPCCLHRPISAGPRTVDLGEIINAILYALWTGCQWRALPREYPHWNTVYGLSDGT